MVGFSACGANKLSSVQIRLLSKFYQSTGPAIVLLTYTNVRESDNQLLLQDSRQAEANDEKGSRQPAAV